VLNEILQTINNTKENIKFTMEEEQNNQLAFLDILLTRTDNGTIRIQTQVYRKKTRTDQSLNYNSNHPTQHKIVGQIEGKNLRYRGTIPFCLHIVP
jgi:hypothetical protein